MTTIVVAIALVACSTVSQQKQPAPVVDALEVQVRLERAAFSTGEIDGRMGANTQRALESFAAARGVPDGDVEAAVAALAREQNVPAVASYRIAPEDVAGPFVAEIPADLMQQASLDSLGYRNALEALAEKLHASPALLQRLNPGKRFAAGETIAAPNIALAPPQPVEGQVVVRLSKARSSLRIETPDGRVLFHAPVTTGSEHDPLPIGEWKVTAILWRPEFHYNPELFWDADPAHATATIAAGPNNPVGVVWIDINKPHYGLHGTSEPARIGRAESHGCVRLTNWDAARLATMVRPDTPVIFEP